MQGCIECPMPRNTQCVTLPFAIHAPQNSVSTVNGFGAGAFIGSSPGSGVTRVTATANVGAIGGGVYVEASPDVVVDSSTFQVGGLHVSAAHMQSQAHAESSSVGRLSMRQQLIQRPLVKRIA